MKLVCFSNNTGGGLVCDLLNKHSSRSSGYKLDSIWHNALKIGDSASIQWSVDRAAWLEKCQRYRHLDKWLGTHVHPSAIPNLDEFSQIVVIATETRTSRLYRWLRYYRGWFCDTFPDWHESDDLASKDRIRELAKNTIQPYPSYHGCWNIEFADVVNGKFVGDNQLNYEYFGHWLQANSFLTDGSSTWASQRFAEAEWELHHKTPFKYI
jgi:hypothetical protein